jgi:hypothetical protein
MPAAERPTAISLARLVPAPDRFFTTNDRAERSNIGGCRTGFASRWTLQAHTTAIWPARFAGAVLSSSEGRLN